MGKVERLLHLPTAFMRKRRQYNNRKAIYRKFSDFTMMSEYNYILNLELCEKYKTIDGDFVECGVWKGGMAAGIAEVLGKDRTIHLFDSFEGLPPAQEIDGPEAIRWQSNVGARNYYDNCSADSSFVEQAFKECGHTKYEIYKGWFSETLQSIKTERIAILRLDGDWYESILTCLNALVPLIVENGIIIIDDYYTWDGCSRAVHDYLSSKKSTLRIKQHKDSFAYIEKLQFPE